jgi:hypothetical protein
MIILFFFSLFVLFKIKILTNHQKYITYKTISSFYNIGTLFNLFFLKKNPSKRH